MCVIFCVIWIALHAVGLVGGTAAVPQPTGEGCFAAGGASCSYRAHRAGGVQAVGTGWYVEIVRDGRTISVGPSDWNDVGGRAVDDAPVIKRGDRVTATTIPGPWQPAAVRVGTLIGDR